MKNKSGMIWFFMFLIILAGCSSHQQLTGTERTVASRAPQVPGSVSSENDANTVSALPVVSEDASGYMVKPVEMEIEEGMPYLPMGAELITKDGKVDLGDIIKAMADHKGFSVSWADDVDQQRPVSCHIKAADNFYSALDNILRQLDYFYEIEEDSIIVRYKETKKYHMAMPNLNEEMSTTLGGEMLPGDSEREEGLKAYAELNIESEAFNFWDALSDALISIVNCEGCPPPIIDRTLGTIMVTASKRVHEDVKNHMAAVEEEAYKQVIIEAKIIEVSLDEDHATGIDWENVFSSTDLQGRTFGGNVGLGDPVTGLLWSKDGGWDRFLDTISINNTTWEVVVSAFQEYGDTRIVANPKVHILNGHGAVLSAGQVLSYLEKCNVTVGTGDNPVITQEATVGYVTEGLSIGIKANIRNDEEVILYVFPAITRLIRFRDIFGSQCGTIQAPQMAVREMATYASVRQGQILVIGGLIQETEDTNTKSVPVLADLPFVGKYFFTYERIENKTSELVILLKPRIINAKTGF